MSEVTISEGKWKYRENPDDSIEIYAEEYATGKEVSIATLHHDEYEESMTDFWTATAHAHLIVEVANERGKLVEDVEKEISRLKDSIEHINDDVMERCSDE